MLMSCGGCALMGSTVNCPAMGLSFPAPGRTGPISSRLHCPIKCCLYPLWDQDLQKETSFPGTEISRGTEAMEG